MSHTELVTLGTITKQTVERVNPNMSFYRWKINGFSQFSREVSAFIVSFRITAIDSKVIWCLKLFPNGRATSESNFMQLGIYYNSLINAKASVDLSIVNVDNEVLQSCRSKKELTLQARAVTGKYVRNGNYINLGKRCEIEDPNNRILANDSLTISFNVTFHDPLFKPPIPSENSNENLKGIGLNLLDDFGQLLESSKFSDVKFVVDNKEIHVHKAILASRSPVFDAMFQHEMQENITNVVVIVDIEYAVMKELFRFIYTDTVANIELMACDLLVAADKYCIKQLKALCENFLLNSLNVDNAIQRLKKAEDSNSANLKNQILEFIVKHNNIVVQKEELASLPPYLLHEIILAMAPKVNAH